MKTFADLGLVPELLKALAEEGYDTPTPIQSQAIPAVLTGADLLGIAQTGTGKTAAFALPIMQRLAADKRAPVRKAVRTLVLSPTRELATQIAESFRAYGRHMGFSVGIVFGGVSQGPQRSMLARGVDVLVATPGRLIDHMQQGNVDLRGTEILVLDEADQMLDLGFLPPIRKIVAKLSVRRQTLFFSATMPPEIAKLAAEFLRDPVKVSVAPTATTVDRVEQKVIHIEQGKKRALLVELFSNPEMARALVFTRTKRGADRVASYLDGAGIETAAIHGNKSQSQREQALAAFKASRIRVLVATDIAARGIDIDLVSHVVNYELPDVPESYVHRIGRTARAGAAGIAISLVDAEERSQLRDIERVTRQTIPSEDRRNDTTLAVDSTPASPRERGMRGGRPQRGRPQGARPQGGRPQGGRGGQRSEGGHRNRPQADTAPVPQFAAAEAPSAHAETRDAGRKPHREERGRPGESRGKAKPHRREGDRPQGARPHGAAPRTSHERPAAAVHEHKRDQGQAHGQAKPHGRDSARPAAAAAETTAQGQRTPNQRNGIRFRQAAAKTPHEPRSTDRGNASRGAATGEISGLGFMRRSPSNRQH